MTSYEAPTTHLLHQELNTCALIEDLLPLYIEGEVSPASRDLMVEHLARCEHCAGFLAGAQSARTQLRRDNIARANSIARDQPAQLAVSTGQRLVKVAALLVLGAVALGVTAGVLGSLSSGLRSVSLIIGLTCFTALVITHPWRRALTPLQWVKLSACCLGGSIGVASFFEPRGGPETQFFGMLLVIASLAGIRFALGKDEVRRT